MTAKRCRHDQRPTKLIIKQKAQGRRNASTLHEQQQPPPKSNIWRQHRITGRSRFKHRAPGASSSNMLQGKWKNLRFTKMKKVRSQAGDDALPEPNEDLLLSVAARLICFPDWQPSRGSSSAANNNLLSAAYMICNCLCCDRSDRQPQFIISY